MGFMDALRKLRTVVSKTDEVLDNPLVKAIVSAVPYGSTVATAVDAANKLFPEEKAGDQKREAVLKALEVKAPELDRNTALYSIEQIVAAINAAEKAKH